MSSVRLNSTSKINLNLRVLSRESDGYHGIETLFQRISLSDEIEVSINDSSKRSLSCDVNVGEETANLAYRAAEAFCAKTNWDTGFEIRIQKKIPAGAGLGGGSADAAATLRAMTFLASRHAPAHALSKPNLLEIAGTLGADVPFLTSDFNLALAWGHGNRFMGLPELEPRKVILAIPPVSVSTADAYRWIDSSPQKHESAGFSLSEWQSWNGIAKSSGNDFTDVVNARHPEIGVAISAMRESGAELTDMTGSGSAVFGVFPEAHNTASSSAATALEPIQRLEDLGFTIIHTDTCIHIDLYP